MPVKLLNSSVFKWPDRDQVDREVRQWAEKEIISHPELISLGYFGSYARGDWGVGSDLDLVAIVRDTIEPFERRSLAWKLESLPVHAEIFIYSENEWQEMQKQGGRFACALKYETIWIYQSV